MSVVVRMEMPRNCHECPVSYQSFGDTPCWCKLAFEKNEAVSDGLMWKETDPTKRPSWCPIICSLPEGHGRLVDADASFLGVIHPSEGWFANYNTTIADRIGEEDMRMVKVIVPAERSET